MKKNIVFLILVFTAASAFAEEDWKYNRRMAITTNPLSFIFGTAGGGFGSSVGFEYAFNPQFSAGTNLYYMNLDPSMLFYVAKDYSHLHSLRFQLESRWYPHENNVHGLFVNGGLQYLGIFGSFTYIDEYYYDYELEKTILLSGIPFEATNTFGFYFGLGYKLIFGKNRYGLVIEPLLEYVYSVHLSSPQISVHYLLGAHWFRFNINFGVAF